ncbi:hypothetical protein U9M48_011791 [Paspalum notatum var. saurae]|uniref:Uncharacterized protein n=1 Tax=Paspalum notatum var. saurae TaxID=547442 RepID=A0AAQ3SY67_PASNO
MWRRRPGRSQQRSSASKEKPELGITSDDIKPHKALNEMSKIAVLMNELAVGAPLSPANAQPRSSSITRHRKIQQLNYVAVGHV